MCGIAGILSGVGGRRPSGEVLRRMASLLRHRGPDGEGFHADEVAGLAHTRLSIIDVAGGAQPIYNEDRTLCIVFNGEIFNYLELRDELQRRGHRFSTRSDTETILHLFEERGAECVHALNGQFAFAVWDVRRRRLFLARDRVGIRPLFYTRAAGDFLFASEVKALFADPRVPRRLDPAALHQVFTYWVTLPPRTAFAGVNELPAGHCLEVGTDGTERVSRYWDPDFTVGTDARDPEECAEELLALLLDATRLQLRSDVPVGAYLSGGLDSSTVATLVKRFTDAPLRTFSVTFEDEAFDESGFQDQVISHLGTDHSSIRCTYRDIVDALPQAVWHAEKPVLRTAPAPFLLLSRLVRASGYKVVLTGEGSDEILAGYDLFKEAKIRRFLARAPGSKFRQRILKRLYPYLEHSPIRSLPYAEAFFTTDASGYPPSCYAHAPRWGTTGRARVFFSADLRAQLDEDAAARELDAALGAGLARFDPLSQAQYVEIKTLLSGYLLSTQGDRMAMANSVEGRYPFLDHRLMEFCFRLPPRLRLRALTEKYLLKRAAGPLLPPGIATRAKQPYRAPDARSIFAGEPPAYVVEALSEETLRRAGYFDPTAVALLVRKCRSSSVLGFKDNMAIVGILSTMLLHRQFVDRFPAQPFDVQGAPAEETRSHA